MQAQLGDARHQAGVLQGRLEAVQAENNRLQAGGDAAAGSGNACTGSPGVVRIGRRPEDSTSDPVFPPRAERQTPGASQEGGMNAG
jgi:hypothetical protein